jgi:hypothetical protein
MGRKRSCMAIPGKAVAKEPETQIAREYLPALKMRAFRMPDKILPENMAPARDM